MIKFTKHILMLGTLLLGAQTGCILPGGRGGPPGLPGPGLPGPGLPGLPKAALPSGAFSVATAKEAFDQDRSPEIVQNEKLANAITAKGFYETP